MSTATPIERYTKLGKIGGGAYGVVYKATDTQTGLLVALKKIKTEVEEDGIPATALREIVFLRQLKHDNVVKLKDIVMEPGKYLLVFEYMDSDLHSVMKNLPCAMAEEVVQSYTNQMLEGLAYCHSMGVMHRDLKPQNLLVSKDGTLKIADFGLCRAFTYRTLTVEVVTRWYRAPEILLGSNTYSPVLDVWSVGCITVEMSTNKVLFEGNCEIDQLHLIFRTFGTPEDGVWPGVTQLPYWRDNFPQWVRQKTWNDIAPDIPPEGHDLLKVSCLRRYCILPYSTCDHCVGHAGV
jgi:serine/threonine protein kinase